MPASERTSEALAAMRERQGTDGAWLDERSACARHPARDEGFAPAIALPGGRDWVQFAQQWLQTP